MEKSLIDLRNYFAIFLILTIIISPGCASIIDGGPQLIPMKSYPSEANLSIIDLYSGDKIYNGKTPYTASLARGAGYFKKARYKIIVDKEGYANKEIIIEGSPNGWYIGGNLFLGGLIGWLIVDPATGAMWTLYPKDINADLKMETSLFQQDKGLTIVLKSQLPELPTSILNKMKPVSIN